MLPFKGKYPKLDPKSHAMPGAELAGDVELKEYASVWQNVSARGDVNKIVTIGHSAIIHASTLEDHVLVGMGAIVLSRCHIGRGSIIGAGALVLEGTEIPPYSLVVGSPAKVIRTDETMITKIHNQAVKYKTLWTKEYGFLPDADGEVWDPSQTIV